MHIEKFIDFLDKLNMEPNLLESSLDGYITVFHESVNTWAPKYLQTVPFVNPVGEPMGSYKNIMKQIPSSISAIGSAGDNTRGKDAYRYGPSLPGSSRDLKDETINDWEGAPKFKKFVKVPSKTMKKVIKKAKEHVPNVGDNMFTPINYHDNFRMGMYDVDYRRPPF